MLDFLLLSAVGKDSREQRWVGGVRMTASMEGDSGRISEKAVYKVELRYFILHLYCICQISSSCKQTLLCSNQYVGCLTIGSFFSVVWLSLVFLYFLQKLFHFYLFIVWPEVLQDLQKLQAHRGLNRKEANRSTSGQQNRWTGKGKKGTTGNIVHLCLCIFPLLSLFHF